MAHFAKLGVNNKVLQIEVLNNSDMLNASNVEDETVGQQRLQQIHGWPANMWIKTSYNTSNNTHLSGDNSKAFRGNYAAIGFTWDENNQIFWPPKPFNSWVKNTSTATWKSPIGDAPALTAEQITQNTRPDGVDENGMPLSSSHAWVYKWNEDNTTWDLINELA